MNNINQYIPPPPDVMLQPHELQDWLRLSSNPADIHAFIDACGRIDEISTRIKYQQAGEDRLREIRQ